MNHNDALPLFFDAHMVNKEQINGGTRKNK